MNNFGFIRVASASPAIEIGNTEYNKEQILTLIQQAAEKNVSLMVFPELSLTGYSCGDLFFNQTLLTGAKTALSEIVKATEKYMICVIVGVPLEYESKLYNAAAVIAGGRIWGYAVKTYLPEYKEFREQRWFTSAQYLHQDEIQVNGEKIPIGNDLIFDLNGVRFGVEICEDLWSNMPPSAKLTRGGAEIICNCAASNMVVGKSEIRRMLVQHASYTSICGYIFSSAGAGESTTDTVYSGHNMVYAYGKKLLESEQNDFKKQPFEHQMKDVLIDVEILRAKRKECTSFTPIKQNIRKIHIPFVDKPVSGFAETVQKTPFLPKNSVQLKEVFYLQTMALIRRMHYIKCSKIVVGVSGGLDSTLALLVAVAAIKQLKLPKNHVIAVTMPGFGTTKHTLQNAQRLMKELQVQDLEIPIVSACRQHFKDIALDAKAQDVTFENAQARERTQILLDIANKNQAIMIGSGDLSELALGYTTYAGDQMSMYSVNAGLPKTLIREVISYIARHVQNHILQEALSSVLKTPISPELLPPAAEGEMRQKTEQILGDYILHDFYLYYFLNYGFSLSKIFILAKDVFCDSYSEEEIKRSLQTFAERFFKQQFKRSCMPDGPKVMNVSLSPRGDWSMASDISNFIWAKEIKERQK